MIAAGTDGVVFVDLDGTLVLENSFQSFLWLAWRFGGWRLRSRLVRAVGRRAVRRRHGRVRMKQAVLRAFESASAETQQEIVRRTDDGLTRTISAPVMSRIEAYRVAGWTIVLATAAPECYAVPFAALLGFDACLATAMPRDDEGWIELLGENKAAACRAWIAANQSSAPTSVAVMTDHVDDGPLLAIAASVVIQAPRPRAEQIAEHVASGARVEFIDPVEEQVGGGRWLWIDDKPSGPHDEWEVRTVLSKHRYALLYMRDATWSRIRPGESLGLAGLRNDCPLPPPILDRMRIMALRRAIRDRLGVFH